MGIRKYIKKQARRAKGWAKKRYVSDGKVDMTKVLKDVSYVKGLLNVEKKYFDIVQSAVAIPGSAATNWDVYRLNAVAQGNQVFQRNGASIRMKSIQIKGRVELGGTLSSATLTSRAHRIRIVLLTDREINGYNTGTLPLVGEVFNGNPVDAMRNFDSILMRRYKLLRTWTITLNNDKPEFVLNYFKKLNMVQKWSTTDTTGVNITQSPLYLCVIGDHPSGDTPPVMNFASRITFIDN